MKKIVILSDTHGHHHDVKVPDGDILICCGDITDDPGRAALRSFLQWFELLPHQHKILVAGNHDWAFQKWPSLAQAMVKEMTHAHYLEDSGVEIEGLKFWGSPYTPEFMDWAFNVERGEKIRAHWDLIPPGVDVLATHGPSYGHLDICGMDYGHVGCKDLYEAVLRVRPRIHAFGHVHHDYGQKTLVHDDGTKTILLNASICNEAYKPTHQPWVTYL